MRLPTSPAALDHAAWALVALGSNPEPSEPNRIQFPICHIDLEFSGQIATRLPGVSPEAIAILRRYQPYVRGNQSKFHPFAIVNRLVRQDKHYELHVALMQPRDFRADVVRPENFIPESVNVPADLIHNRLAFAPDAESCTC